MLRRILLLLITTTLLIQQPSHSAAFSSKMASWIGLKKAAPAPINPAIASFGARALAMPAIAQIYCTIGLIMSIGIPVIDMSGVGMRNIYERLCIKFYQNKLDKTMAEYAKLLNPATYKKEADARNAELKKVMGANLADDVPGVLDLINGFQDHHADMQPQIQAKIAQNLVEQNRLQTLVRKHQFRLAGLAMKQNLETAATIGLYTAAATVGVVGAMTTMTEFLFNRHFYKDLLLLKFLGKKV